MTAVPESAVLASSMRRAILDRLADAGKDTPTRPGRSAAELAAALHRHVTTVRFHLDQLVSGGFLRTSWERLPRAGRPRKLYELTDHGDPAHDQTEAHFQVLAQLLAASWPSEGGAPVSPEEAGRRWAREHADPATAADAPAVTAGRWLAKVGDMVDLLEQWGYSPDLTTSNGGRTVTVCLDHCPFLAVASVRPDVVCGVHRGLIRGALEHSGEPHAEVDLKPFVGPHHCLVHVSTLTPFSATAPNASEGEPR